MTGVQTCALPISNKLLDDMQNNHAQWHIERTNTKKVNAVTESNNEELAAKVDELLSALKHKKRSSGKCYHQFSN